MSMTASGRLERCFLHKLIVDYPLPNRLFLLPSSLGSITAPFAKWESARRWPSHEGPPLAESSCGLDMAASELGRTVRATHDTEKPSGQPRACCAP